MTPVALRAAEYIDKAQACDHLAAKSSGEKRKNAEKSARNFRKLAEIVLKNGTIKI